MGRFIDLVGKKFGRWTVIEIGGKDKNGRLRWKCICDCELKSIKLVDGNSLRMGTSKGCGCSTREATIKRNKNRFIDLTGMRFGRLVVLRIDKKDKRDKYYYICECDCGNKEFSVIGKSLKIGRTKSCGCLAKELTSKRTKKYNTYDLTGEYGIGYTTKGEEFYFDLEDYDKIKDYCWNIFNGYIVNRDSLKIHRIIMDAEDGEVVDHITGICTDNRKSNLRIVDNNINMLNKKQYKNTPYGNTGVRKTKYNTWSCRISFNKKQINLGSYRNKEDAIRVREIAELLLFKEYSRGYHELKEKYANEDTSDVEAIIKKKQESIQNNT